MTSTRGRLSVLLSAAALAVGLLGCSSIQTWDPGAPDALTTEHYDLTKAAIDAKSKLDAQAALQLLRADVQRMRTNAQTMMAALARLYGVSNAVDREDWSAARNGILELDRSYGRP
jgi:hypothetical protein